MPRQYASTSNPIDPMVGSTSQGLRGRQDRSDSAESNDLMTAGARRAHDRKLIIDGMKPLMEAFNSKLGRDTHDFIYSGPNKGRQMAALKASDQERVEIARNRRIANRGPLRDMIYRGKIAAGTCPGHSKEQSLAMHDLADVAGFFSRTLEIKICSQEKTLSHFVTVVARTGEELEGLPSPDAVAAEGLVVVDARLKLICGFSEYSEVGREAALDMSRRDIGIRGLEDRKIVSMALLGGGIASFPTNAQVVDVARLPLIARAQMATHYGDTWQPPTPRHTKCDVDTPSR